MSRGSEITHELPECFEQLQRAFVRQAVSSIRSCRLDWLDVALVRRSGPFIDIIETHPGMHADVMRSLAFISNPLTLAGVVLVIGFLVTRLACCENPVEHFLLQLASFAGFTAMLSEAAVSPFAPTGTMGFTNTYVIISVFKIVWWIAASWLLAGFVRAVLVFKRQPMETRFFQDLCAGIIYSGAVLGIVADVFDRPVSGLLAASGVIAVVLDGVRVVLFRTIRITWRLG